MSTNSISGDLDSIDTAAALSVNIGQDGLGSYTDNGAVGIRDGRIDDVAVWRRSLGAAEVRTIFQRGQQGRDLFGLEPRPQGFPSLQVRRSNEGLRVFWPKSEVGYRLERTASLGATADWVAVDSIVVGDENASAVIEETAAFYRLRKP